MAINYYYPHVSINKNVLERRRNVQEFADTTIMFVPFISKKGPNNVIVPIHSLDEFIATFGELDYATQGQTALNIMNWLTSGNGNSAANGTVYAYRCTKDSHIATAKGVPTTVEGTTTTPTISGLSAKYPGSFYNQVKMEMEVTADKKTARNITIKLNNAVVERFFNVSVSNVAVVLNSSDYIKVTAIDSLVIESGENSTFRVDGTTNSRTITFSDGTDEASQETVLIDFWTISSETSKADVIQNALETPIDVIMDAGYSIQLKIVMLEYLMTYRQDVILFLDEYILSSNGTAPTIGNLLSAFAYANDSVKKEKYEKYRTNLAVYQQYFTINENTLFENETSIYVTPSYFIAKLLPYNDATYGVQYPMAGLRRGVISGATSVNVNPKPSIKDEWFTNRYNYVEKSSREYAFMSQRTFDGSSTESYTALSFLNNSRALQKIVKEIERISREYLFEYNDAITLSQLRAELNKYINTWLANRTLNKAEVDVRKNEFSNEAVDVTIVIRFTDTIEIITVDLTVE